MKTQAAAERERKVWSYGRQREDGRLDEEMSTNLNMRRNRQMQCPAYKIFG